MVSARRLFFYFVLHFVVVCTPVDTGSSQHYGPVNSQHRPEQQRRHLQAVAPHSHAWCMRKVLRRLKERMICLAEQGGRVSVQFNQDFVFVFVM